MKRALYGLKWAPRPWYARIDGYLQSMGLTKPKVDPNLYYVHVKGDLLILVLYVDHLFLTMSEVLIAHYKRDLAREFEMDLKLMH